MNKEKYGVHIAHCCYIHGCKYGDKDCPVASGEVAQKHLCYDCSEGYEPYTLEEIEFLRKTKSYRPTYDQLKNKVADLETKLAEKENEISSYIEESVNLTNGINYYFDENKKLKQQLAEKEQEIESYKHTVYMNMLNQEMLELKVATQHQNKIEFAIEKISKIKDFVNIEINECDKELAYESEDDYFNQAVEARQSALYDIRRVINTQIAELKKEKGNENDYQS